MSRAEEFWSSQSAWWSGHKEAQDKARFARVESPVGRRFLGALADGSQFLTGGAPQTGLIRVDPRLQRDLLVLIQRAAPALVAAFDEHLGGLAQAAFSQWPVRSGLSKALVSLEFTMADSTMRGRLVSRAPYTPYIKGQPHRTLIDQKGAAVAERIAVAAIEEIVHG